MQHARKRIAPRTRHRQRQQSSRCGSRRYIPLPSRLADPCLPLRCDKHRSRCPVSPKQTPPAPPPAPVASTAHADPCWPSATGRRSHHPGQAASSCDVVPVGASTTGFPVDRLSAPTGP